MAFELFERKLGRTSTTPTIGLQKKGTLSLNAAAFALLTGTQTGKSIKNTPAPSTKKSASGKLPVLYVEFLFDRARQIFGMRVASADGRNSYPIRKQPGSESYIVAGKAFLEHHDVKLGTLRRFTPRVYEGNVVGFSLSEE
jgi:hypothetical protein